MLGNLPRQSLGPPLDSSSNHPEWNDAARLHPVAGRELPQNYSLRLGLDWLGLSVVVSCLAGSVCYFPLCNEIPFICLKK